MMYGFGDDTPAPDTIAMMEELVIDHITDIATNRVSTNRGKIKVDDFRFALRNDPKKLARLDELLFMQEEIARARRGFDNSFNDYANDEDLAAARADVAAGIGTLGGPGSNAAAATGAGGGAAGAGPSKKPALSANPSAAGGLALPGSGLTSKAKGKQKA
ncbi:TFIID-18kDa-domain-containing protein [Rhodotorula sp. JG-1b]|nr:TFIID-18kDa-domain-containing protein [Rhodotorula sp. JG-1b]